MKHVTIATVSALALTAGCKPAAAPTAAAIAAPISEAEAGKIVDATVASWLSKDATRIKAMYASDVAAYDVTTPTLFVDRTAWDTAQDAFAKVGMDGATLRERKIQVLSPDVFVMNGAWDVTNSANPKFNGPLRCTVVYRRDDKGSWPIAAEQCSEVPKPA